MKTYGEAKRAKHEKEEEKKMEIDEINVRAMFMSSPVIVHITNYQLTCDGDAMRRSMHAEN